MKTGIMDPIAALDNLTIDQKRVVVELLRCVAVQDLMGADETGMSEEDEGTYWDIYKAIGGS